MRKLAVKVIQLLDGTPAVYGKRQAGQSVVELALLTPILIVLLAGLVEIGWFANNYLNLLDVTRTGARRGSVLQDSKSPLFWNNLSSYVPNALLDAQNPPATGYGMPPGVSSSGINNGSEDDRFEFRWTPDSMNIAGDRGSEPCNPTYVDRVFYNEIICTMITSMEPLTLNPENGIDDIVVSALSLQLIDATVHPEYLAPSYDRSKLQMVVVGRYPTNANECDVANGGGTQVPFSREGRDPFDFNANNAREVKPPLIPDTSNHEIAGTYTEIAGYDEREAGNANAAEKQVGFSLFGNHKIDGTFCVGSEWTMSEIENLMNVPSYGLLTNSEKKLLPSQGIVLVEMFWEHEMLLKIPLLSPVYTAVGNQDGKMVISVWAAFPQAAVEPHILFPE